MTDNPEKKVPQAAERRPDAAPPPDSRHGVVITILVMIIVAGIVVAGVVPRLRARAALRTETHEQAVPTVVVIHPKRGAPQQEIVLPGDMQPFTDAPIYARTTGYLKKWYFDMG